MLIFIAIIALILGFVALVYGADRLVEGASSLARSLRVSDLVIGLTIVAFGTSFPELVVNVISAIHKSTDLALGNILGSNIFNILVILGISACITPLMVQRSTQWIEIPLALLSALALLIMGNDVFLDGKSNNVISKTDGLVLLLFFLLFIGYIINTSINNRSEITPSKPKYKTGISILFIILGLVLLVIGAEAIVRSSSYLARLMGISERVIGLTIVAIGTSLPELATSVIAARKKSMDIAIANIVGSNIFNSFFILGVTSVIRPIPISAGSSIDLIVNFVVTLLLFGYLFVGKKRTLTRPKGIVLILCYVLYMIWLFWHSAH